MLRCSALPAEFGAFGKTFLSCDERQFVDQPIVQSFE